MNFVNRDLGDFQTPLELVRLALQTLDGMGIPWRRALEPTCGHGAFIRGLLQLDRPPKEIQGIEIQDDYVRNARSISHDDSKTSITVHKANIFETDLERDITWSESGPLLVVGNPPWITSAELGGLGSSNLPEKTNFKGFRGLDAITGRSNFDIAEYIWLKVLDELRYHEPTVAFLCKTSVARNVLSYAHEMQLPVICAKLYRIDAKKWFSAAVDACWFVVMLGSEKARCKAPVFESLQSTEPVFEMGMFNGRLVSNLAKYERYAFIDAGCSLIWRQGIKHDAAQIMEISATDDGYRNKLNQNLDIEADYVYPLLKSSDVVKLEHPEHRLSIIVPQKQLGEDTEKLSREAPKLWAYLAAHANVFAGRKSSIYRGKPPFSIFGIGDYAFAPYKVVTSGFYKRPHFRAVGPVGGRPVMVDDTCYYLPCHSAPQAALITSLLRDEACLDLIESLVFWDAKRPITKSLLQRIDLHAILKFGDREKILERARDVLRRLIGAEEAGAVTWPPDLETLLVDYVPEERGLIDDTPVGDSVCSDR